MIQSKKTLKDIFYLKSLYIEYSEPLEKSDKLPHYLKFMGDHPKAQETAEWAGGIKHRGLAEFGMRHAKTKPEGLNDEEKTKIQHFNDSLHMPEVATAAGSLNKKHDFNSGIEILENAENAYQKKHAELAPKLAPLEGDKLLDLGEGIAVYRLPLNKDGKNAGEATAMGHCATPHKGGELWSIRKDHGNGMCEPMVTLSHEDGYLGEVKGRHNWKPSERHHPLIAKLMASDLIKGYVGGGYRPESNFHFDDMKDGLKKKLLEFKPSLTQSVYKEFLPPGLAASPSIPAEVKSVFSSDDAEAIDLALNKMDSSDESLRQFATDALLFTPLTASPTALDKIFHFYKKKYEENPSSLVSYDNFKTIGKKIADSDNAGSDTLNSIFDSNLKTFGLHPSLFSINKNISSDTMRKMIQNGLIHKHSVLGFKNTPQEIIDEANNSEDILVNPMLFRNENISDEKISQAMKNPLFFPTLSHNPKMSSEQLQFLWNNRDKTKKADYLSNGIISHKNTNPELISQILDEQSNDNERNYIIHDLINHRDCSVLPSKLLDKIISIKTRSNDLSDYTTASDLNDHLSKLSNLSLESLQHLYNFARDNLNNEKLKSHSRQLILNIKTHPKFELFSDEIKQQERPFLNVHPQKIISILNNEKMDHSTKQKANEELEIRKKAKHNSILYSDNKDVEKLKQLAQSHQFDIAFRAQRVLKHMGLKKSLQQKNANLQKAGLGDKIKAGLIAGSTALFSSPTNNQTNQPEPPKQESVVKQPIKPVEDKQSKLLKPGEILEDYQDPRHIPTEEFYEEKYGLPKRLITSIRVAGEMSHWNEGSDLGTKTAYQFTPSTRDLYIKKYNVDPWKDSDSSIHATALHLKESMDWAKKKFKTNNQYDQGVLAAQHFHGGPNTKLWGKNSGKYGYRINKGWKMLLDDPALENLDHIFKQPKAVVKKSLQDYVYDTLQKSLQEVKAQSLQEIIDEVLHKSFKETT